MTVQLGLGGMPKRLFAARPGRLCGWCDYSRGCPEGLAAAGAPKQPWDGLAEGVRAPRDRPGTPA